jgi:hypothetical protein
LSCKNALKRDILRLTPVKIHRLCENQQQRRQTWKNLCKYIFITPVDRKGCSALRRFLNDVQKAKTPAQYSINSTFLPGQVSASNFKRIRF